MGCCQPKILLKELFLINLNGFILSLSLSLISKVFLVLNIYLAFLYLFMEPSLAEG